MKKRQQNNPPNIRPLAIGLLLIIAVAAITILKPIIQNRKNPNPAKQSVTADKIKDDEKYSVSADELIRKVQKRDYVAIIDLRDADSFKKEHLIDSINLTPEDIDKNVDTVNKTKEIVVVDEKGEVDSSAGVAAKYFQDRGFQNAHFLRGGFSLWTAENRPIISEGDPNSFADQAKVKYVNSDELKKMLDEGNSFLVVDVRKIDSFKDGHIKGSINIFLDDIERRRAELPIGKKIILADNDGVWAMKASVRLFDLGYFNSFALSDGLDSWKAKGFEVEE
jgi:rhodanese-related sulfurtransferase